MKKYFRRKSLEKAKKTAKALAFNGLGQIKNALILFNTDTPNKTGFVLLIERLLKENGAQVATLGYIPVKLKKEEEPAAHYYYQNQLNWLGNPKQEIVKELTSTNFDVVIDLDLQIKTPNTFILLKVNAGLRVGFTSEKQDYDLVINKQDHKDEELVKQLEHYLKSIKKV